MKTFSTIAVAALTAVGLGLTTTAFGDGCDKGSHGAGEQHDQGMRGMHSTGEHGGQAETRLNTLKSELKLTTNQTKAWETFETAVRNQAGAMSAMHASMQSEQHSPDTHVAMMEQRLAGMKTVQKARIDLYKVLTPEQKAVFDRTGSHNHRG